jgi:YVTN family beta-propeller protein
MNLRLLVGIILASLLSGAAQAQWLDTTLGVGLQPWGLCYNPQDNKVYCANLGNIEGWYGSVTVIDGATNQVIATDSPTGAQPHALCWNSKNDKVYCANVSGGNVTIIDGVTNQVITTVQADTWPYAVCYNP